LNLQCAINFLHVLKNDCSEVSVVYIYRVLVPKVAIQNSSSSTSTGEEVHDAVSTDTSDVVDDCTLTAESDAHLLACHRADELSADEDSDATEYLDVVPDCSNSDESVSEQVHYAFSLDTQLMTSDESNNCALSTESNAHLLACRPSDDFVTDAVSEVPLTELSEDLTDAINAGASVIDVINADDDIQQTVDVMCQQPQNIDIAAHNNLPQTESMAPTDLMLLLLKMKHHLTKEATVDIAKLINVVTGNDTVASSIHNLEKNFTTNRDSVEIHHVCKACGSRVGVVSGDCVCCPNIECSCKITVQASLKGGHFFCNLPLRYQLTDLFQNHEVTKVLNKSLPPDSNGNFCDIVDGKMYKQLKLARHGAQRDITITFNCDGVPVFKSSSFSIWPILCVVNELPCSIRGNHVLMASLWFGSGKPDMSVFLEPFVDECIELAENGFGWICPETAVRITGKARVIVGVCDSVARPLMQNFKQFNGRHGCGFCFDTGESVEKGNGRTTVYPFNEDMTLRTKENTHALVMEAVETKAPCIGVKGPSVLSLLPYFDLIHGFVPDYMHCICLGVVRQLASLWFDSKNHNEPFYIGPVLSRVDSRLLSIKPPCSLSRTPRSVSQLKFWKAHEWLAWLLYYSLPVLKGILPHTHYTHWALLVDCVSILLGKEISLAQLVYCERGLVQFVSDFENLYGKQHLSFNVHQTLHLVQSVRDWGPLWSHSAFLFESYNSVLLNMIRGTQGVPMQILHSFFLTRAIPSNVANVLPDCSPAEQEFIQSLTSHRRTVKSVITPSTGVTLLGQAMYRNLKRPDYVALHCMSPVVTQTVVAYYDRAVIHGELVHSLGYCKSLKRNSYTVCLVDGRYFQVSRFIVADLGFGLQCYAIGRYLCRTPFQFCASKKMACLKLTHIIPVSKTPSALLAVAATDIAKKCIFISLDCYNVNFVCDQVHSLEYCM